tara:strand:+ start:515 stop:676 length:162 start_codon:yes stop_codon:yes gene_type:complete
MTAVIYALAVGVLLGFLSADADTLWLKIPGYSFAAWMFLAAILQAVRITRDGE